MKRNRSPKSQRRRSPSLDLECDECPSTPLSSRDFVREMNSSIRQRRQREWAEHLNNMRSGRSQMALEPFSLADSSRRMRSRSPARRSRSPTRRSRSPTRRSRSPARRSRSPARRSRSPARRSRSPARRR